jgi:rod shape-determining protein MreC
VYDKKVRRRRAVLAGLVALSLILLTAFVGERAGGPFHSIQRGVVAILSPIQEGASRALKPARDLVGWFGDSIHARGQRDKLESERNRLLKRVVGAEAARAENRQLRQLVGLDGEDNLARFKPVAARVIGRSPTVWYSTIEIDRGSSDGVRVDQPVVAGPGLIGRVSQVTGGSSVITLLTDHTSGVAAKVLDARGDSGVVVPEIGNPDRLLIQTLPPRSPVQAGDNVVTAGTRSKRFPSLFPPNIPIGSITRVSADELTLSQQAHLKPVVDLRRIDFVQILTRRDETLRAQTP